MNTIPKIHESKRQQKLRILVYSEFVIFKKGLRLLIEKEENLAIIGESMTKNELFESLKISRPDILIINLSGPSESVVSICKNVYEKHEKLPILLFLDCSTDISIPELIIFGVRGIIWKENLSDDLIEAIVKIGNGGLFFKNPDQCKLICHFSKKNHHENITAEENEILSHRETEVLKLFTSGYTYKEISNLLKISTRTVEAHKEHIQFKLNLHTKAELVKYAISNGIL